ncbi:MAG: hypothetical protein LBR07_04795 [Puniceicoccales bacterium]|jgi:hypothetical protein|nr:hypothetical protein [Puniceicoccales bacterium]
MKTNRLKIRLNLRQLAAAAALAAVSTAMLATSTGTAGAARGDRDRDRREDRRDNDRRDDKPAPAPAPHAPAPHAPAVRAPAPPVAHRPAPPPVQRHPKFGAMNRPHWTGSVWLVPPRIVVRGAPVVWFDISTPFAYVRAGAGWVRVEGDLVRWYDGPTGRTYRVYGTGGWYEPAEIRFAAPTPVETPVVWADGWSVALWSGLGWVSIAPNYVRANPRGGYLVWSGGAWQPTPATHVRYRPAPPPPPAPAPQYYVPAPGPRHHRR